VEDVSEMSSEPPATKLFTATLHQFHQVAAEDVVDEGVVGVLMPPHLCTAP